MEFVVTANSIVAFIPLGLRPGGISPPLLHQLVWSCRMEEQMRWGQNMRMVPRTHDE